MHFHLQLISETKNIYLNSSLHKNGRAVAQLGRASEPAVNRLVERL